MAGRLSKDQREKIDGALREMFRAASVAPMPAHLLAEAEHFNRSESRPSAATRRG